MNPLSRHMQYWSIMICKAARMCQLQKLYFTHVFVKLSLQLSTVMMEMCSEHRGEAPCILNIITK